MKFYCLYNFIIQILYAPSNILGLNVVSPVNLLQKKIQVYYLEYFFNNNGIQPCKSINPFLGLPYKSTHKVAAQQLASPWPNLMATSQDPEG